jgi:SNF2 family DNA or RNA helicase
MLRKRQEALLDLLEPIVESGEKVLIFSQYVRMCRILEEQIAVKFAIRPLVYEGSLRQAKRDEVLQQFDKDPARQVLILSLRAGGVGLNLT